MTDTNSIEYHSELYKNEEWLDFQYSVKQKSQSDIGDIFDVSQRTIKYWMDKYNIDSRGPEGADSPDFDLEKCISLYRDGLGTRRIENHVDASRNTISRWLDKCGVERHNPGNRKRTPEVIDTAISLYKSGKTEKEIAEHIDVDVTQATVSRWLRSKDVETRNQAGFGQVCYSDDGLEVKSRLEQKTANWLENNISSFEYEPDVDGTNYVPDFIVGNTIVEVWGITGSDEYEKRRDKKCIEYEELGYNVISVEPNYESFDEQLSELNGGE